MLLIYNVNVVDFVRRAVPRAVALFRVGAFPLVWREIKPTACFRLLYSTDTRRLHPAFLLPRRVFSGNLHVRHRELAASLPDDGTPSLLEDTRPHPLLLWADPRWDSRQPVHRHLRHDKQSS